MKPSFRFIFVPLGSAGDVNPLVWLARVMTDRGHESAMVIQASMAEHATRAGLPVVPVGDVAAQESLVRDPALWHPQRAFRLLAKNFPVWAREMVPAIRSLVIPNRTVIVGASISFGARLVAEADGVPHVTTHLQPALFMSAHDSPVLMIGMERLKRRPLWLRRLLFGMGNWETDRQLKGATNRVRAELGIHRPVKNILRDWAPSPDLILGLFPDWFGPHQPDWPPQAISTRFPLYDEASDRALPPGLETFLSAGDPPVLLTPGSANMHARKFFMAATDASWQLKRRSLLITPFKENLPPALPTGCAHFEFAPFSAIFSRCAALVHHGGIGTCSQGLAAGVPQLLMAMAHDQPDNGWRLRQLGVGDYLYPGKFHPAEVAHRLKTLIESPIVADSCREIKQRINDQMPAEKVAEMLERFASQKCARAKQLTD
jgi:UDP:flavonoid glycosyltransferase YjiC (YdhE family)